MGLFHDDEKSEAQEDYERGQRDGADASVLDEMGHLGSLGIPNSAPAAPYLIIVGSVVYQFVSANPASLGYTGKDPWFTQLVTGIVLGMMWPIQAPVMYFFRVPGRPHPEADVFMAGFVPGFKLAIIAVVVVIALVAAVEKSKS